MTKNEHFWLSTTPNCREKKLESTYNVRLLQLKFLLDENETMQPMRTRVTKVRQAKTSIPKLTKM